MFLFFSPKKKQTPISSTQKVGKKNKKKSYISLLLVLAMALALVDLLTLLPLGLTGLTGRCGYDASRVLSVINVLALGGVDRFDAEGGGAAGTGRGEEGPPRHDDHDPRFEALLRFGGRLGAGLATSAPILSIAISALEVAGDLPVGAGEDEESEGDEAQHREKQAVYSQRTVHGDTGRYSGRTAGGAQYSDTV